MSNFNKKDTFTIGVGEGSYHEEYVAYESILAIALRKKALKSQF